MGSYQLGTVVTHGRPLEGRLDACLDSLEAPSDARLTPLDSRGRGIRRTADPLDSPGEGIRRTADREGDIGILTPLDLPEGASDELYTKSKRHERRRLAQHFPRCSESLRRAGPLSPHV